MTVAGDGKLDTLSECDETTAAIDSKEVFDARFRVICEPALLRAEQQALGTSYGASSYTTLEQADRLAVTLQLGPGTVLLDVGSGAGWPGVYLAETTGCAAILTDLSVEGPRVAAERIGSEGLDAVAFTASGTDLPLRNDIVHAVTCSDVFC